MRDAIDALHSLSPLRLVIFTGGEPLLLGKDLLDTISYADSFGISTRVVTNAFWADTPENAGKVLSELREAGLKEINVSTDDFHAPYVPFENVRNVYNGIRGMGFVSFVVANCVIGGDVITPEYIVQELGDEFYFRYEDNGNEAPLPPPSEDGTTYVLSNRTLQRLGRAQAPGISDKIKNPRNQTQMNVGCRNIAADAVLSADNHLLLCCGVYAGGLAILDRGEFLVSSVAETFEKAHDDVFVNAIAHLGPYTIRNFILSHDPSVVFPEMYAHVCEICQSILTNDKAVAVLQSHTAELARLLLLVLELKESVQNTITLNDEDENPMSHKSHELLHTDHNACSMPM